ncbi:MAG: helix-turn-helix domain-containing protein [Acidimicrobiales bacterium]
MPPPSPTVARLELASTLKARRWETGRDARTVFQALHVSRNHLSAIENARALPTEEMLDAIATVLECDAEEGDYLRNLLRIARERGWWDEYARHVNADLLELCGLEHGAERLRIFDPRVVTGLLQTEEYARALTGASPDLSRLVVDSYVGLRMRRQERLRPPDPLVVTVVQGETALYQEIGGADVLLRQLRHLATVIDDLESTLSFHVQPFSSTPSALATASSIALFDFTTPYLGTMAWEAGQTTAGVTADPEQIELLEPSFELTLESCLDREASRDLVHRRLAELEAEL